MHAGYFLGLVILGIYIIGELSELLIAEYLNKEKSEAGPTLQSILTLCGALGVCILLTIVNPNGIQIIFYPFQTLTSPSMQQFIQEWFSPDFHQLIWQPLAWLILALIGVGMISKKSISPTNILLIIVFGYAALLSMRNVPFFAIMAIPVLTEQVGSLIRIQSDSRVPKLPVRFATFILLLCVLLITGFRFSQVVLEQPRTEAENFPKAAVDWLLVNKPTGNLFNSYGWGGYLIWRTYPEYKVYIDGRADVYGDAFIYNYVSIYHAEPGWEKKLEEQSVHTVLIESDAPLANMLRQSGSWHIVFEDKVSIIFTH